MKMSLSKRDQLLLASGFLVLVLLVVYFQLFYLTPLKSDLSIAQQNLQSEQKLLEVAGQKEAASRKTIVSDTSVLQKKLPVAPLEDQFILDLGKAGTLSNSDIQSMSFTENQDVALAAQSNGNSQQTNPNGSVQPATTPQTAPNQGTSSQSTINQKNTSSAQASSQAATLPPAGLKKLTANLSVESPSYEQFEKFIQTIESLDRIVVVESINYTGGKEITSLDQQSENLTYNLVISTYYMPTLTDLKAQLPKVDAPSPAGKDNPLAQFPDTTNSP